MKNKKIVLSLLFIVFLLFIPIKAFANEAEVKNEIINSIEDELGDFKDSIPPYVLETLPNSLLDGDFSSLLSENFGEKEIWSYIIEYLFFGLGAVLKTFASILVLILLSSIFEMISNSLENDSMRLGFRACSSLCVAITVFNVCISLCELVTSYINALCQAMVAFMPIMASMQIMGGKLSSATVTNTSMVLFISIVEGFFVVCLLPLVKICMMFSCAKAMGGIEFGGISKIIRTTFTSVTIFVMSIFMFIFSYKNIISQGNDSLSLKTARFAISSFVPMVGASINDALRTVSTSLGVIKNSCGVIALIVIALIVIPIIIYVFLNKVSFGLLAGISRAIGCEKQSMVLEEADSLCSYMLTLVACTCVLFIFAITLFIMSSIEVPQ